MKIHSVLLQIPRLRSGSKEHKCTGKTSTAPESCLEWSDPETTRKKAPSIKILSRPDTLSMNPTNPDTRHYSIEPPRVISDSDLCRPVPTVWNASSGETVSQGYDLASVMVTAYPNRTACKRGVPMQKRGSEKQEGVDSPTSCFVTGRAVAWRTKRNSPTKKEFRTMC